MDEVQIYMSLTMELFKEIVVYDGGELVELRLLLLRVMASVLPLILDD